jgi:H+/Cl- antiporter ClcA
MWLLSAVGAVLGLVGGGAAVGLFKLIGLITHLTLLHDFGTSLPGLRGYHPSPWIIATAVAGALIVSLFAVWSPVIRGHGIPESLEAILIRGSKIRPRAAVAKPLSAAVTIGTGGPFGAEGPIIVTGGSVGSLIGQLLPTSPTERKIMLATGAAAGMSGTFDTPVAAVILAIELVLFERKLRSLVPLSIAAAVAAGIHIVAFGSRPLFFVATQLHVGLTHLPLFVLVGLASGLLAVVLNKGLFAVEAGFRKLPVKIFWWPAIGAVGFAVIGLAVPRTLSMGYSAISDTLNGRFTLAALGILCVAKLASWLVALGSQTSGGTLAPMFLVGATMGGALGGVLNVLWPGLHIAPAAFALVAMGATFGAGTKAVLASVVFAVEVTGQYHMIIPMLIGVGVAELVAELFLSDRMMTEKLSHRGFRVDFDTAVEPLRMRIASQVMREPVSLRASATVAEARRVLREAQLPALAVLGAGGCYLGLLSSAALDRAEVAAGDPIDPLVSTVTTPLRGQDYLADALTRFLASGLDALPVVDDGRVVGQLSRADLEAERERQHTEAETRQPGWLTGLGSRRRAGAAARARAAAPGDGSAGTAGHGGFPAVAGEAMGLRIVPWPARVSSREGQFSLTEASRIILGPGSEPAAALAETLAARLRPATGYLLPVGHGRGHPHDIILHLARPAGLAEVQAAEGYELAAGSNGLSLTAGSRHGLYNGAQTIRALLPAWIASPTRRPGPWVVPGVHIVDYPRYAYRGLMLDISRGTLTPDEVARLVDHAGSYKLNTLHLRLSAGQGMRLAGQAGPARTPRDHQCPDEPPEDPGGGWSQEQYRRLVEHAAAHYITVVPEVELPDRDDAGAWTACTAIIGRAASLWPGPYYHLGGGGLPEPLLRPVARATRHASIQSGIATGLGKTVIRWAATGMADAPPAAGSVIEYWAPEAGTGPRLPAATAAAGSRVVMAPADHAYLSQKYPGAGPNLAPLGLAWARESGCGVDRFYNWDPADGRAGLGEADILGVEAVLWGHTVRTARDAEYLMFPRLPATAEIGWSPRVERTGISPAYAGFLARLAAHGTALALTGTNFYPSPMVPWCAELAASTPSVRHRRVSGWLAELIAPGAEPGSIAATIDWGDGTVTPATLVTPGAAPATGTLVYAITGVHTYRRSGDYRVTVTARVGASQQARAALAVRTRRPPWVGWWPWHPRQAHREGDATAGERSRAAGARSLTRVTILRRRGTSRSPARAVRSSRRAPWKL